MTRETSGLALAQLLSKLIPPIFSHPLWSDVIHLPEKSACLSEKLPVLIESLLQKGDPLSACQLALAEAALDKRRINLSAALNHIQISQRIAEENILGPALDWVDWGYAAIKVHQGQPQEAGIPLAQLQERLSDSGDWVLANLVEFTRLQLPELSPDTSDGSLPVMWLLRWGDPPEAILAVHARRTLPELMISQDRFFTHLGRQAPPLVRRLRLWLARLVIGESTAMLSFRTNSQTGVLEPGIDEKLVHHALGFPAATAQPPTSGEKEKQMLENPLGKSIFSIPPNLVEHSLKRQKFVGLLKTTVLVYYLGKFRFYVNEIPIEEWLSRKGLAVLKYLLMQHDRVVPREVLMEAFWPGADPEAARNNLNVALHGLRESLRVVTDRPIIIYELGNYGLESDVEMWIDLEEFEQYSLEGNRLEAAGQLERAVRSYEAAINLYQGGFLEEDPYEEWTILPRERLRFAYLDLLSRLSNIKFDKGEYSACVGLCQRILDCDNCREESHQRLMVCYSRQGQASLALRQYQVCIEALHANLDVEPETATTQLVERIRRHERV